MKKVVAIVCMMVAGMNASFAQGSDNTLPVQATTDMGSIEGNFDVKTGVQKYFGIPFAKPPVGDLRWKAPQPLTPWKGVKETKKFGPRPVQGVVFGDMMSRSAGLSEDCLYLNVWSNAKKGQKGLPVLVYFYGGGNVAGDGSEPRYDGETMAKKGIVVVTCNYRLNIFGNFAHPELSAETTYKGSGNYGYYDQLAALKWVQKNIANFGGDPGHVTIAGESAGSVAVSYQMSSPLTKGLVHAAIGESGAGINPTMAPTPLAEAEKIGKEFGEKAGYKTLKELRALSTKELFDVYSDARRFGFPVVIDGYFLPKKLSEIYAAKEQSQIPLLAGWNSAEVGGMGLMQGKPYTVENYTARIKAEFPTTYEEVLKLYPAHSEREAEVSATALTSDRFIVYATWKWMDLHRNNSSQPVYRYLYSKLRPALVDQSLASGLAGGTVRRDPNAAPAPVSIPVGAPHACEIEYCMGNLHLVKEYAWTADDFKVSETMNNYFANFIKTYNPNGKDLPEWKPYSKDETPFINIDVKTKLENSVIEGRYKFLDGQYK